MAGNLSVQLCNGVMRKYRFMGNNSVRRGNIYNSCLRNHSWRMQPHSTVTCKDLC